MKKESDYGRERRHDGFPEVGKAVCDCSRMSVFRKRMNERDLAVCLRLGEEMKKLLCPKEDDPGCKKRKE